MTARPGDAFPTDLIFPPFVPRNLPQTPSAPPAPESSAPAPEAAAEEEPAELPWVAPEASGEASAEAEALDAAEIADFAQPGDGMPWDLPDAPSGEDVAGQEETADDLPWLELPEGSRAAEAAVPESWQPAAEEAFAEAEPWTLPEADEAPTPFADNGSFDDTESFADTDSLAGTEPVAGADSFAEPEASAPVEGESGDEAAETVPDWMAWDPGTAAAVTETPELPPPGDVEAAAAAREPEPVDPQALAGSLEGLESFDRSDVPAVEPVSGLAPVGDFDVPSEPPAAYETPDWAQPNPAWRAPAAVPPAADEDLVPGAAFGASSVDDELAAELRGIADAAVLDETATAPAADPGYASPGVAGIAAEVAHPARAEVPVAGAAPGDDRLGAMLGEVAGRLEAIARSLRERSPAEVLAGPSGGSADPLELLVTGFVLGYVQRGGR